MMKKTMLFAGITALLMIASCQKEETPSQNSAKDLVFTATIENSSTKTTVDAVNAKVAWAMNDEITVTDNSSVSVKYIVTAIDGSGKATFTKKSGESGTLGSGPYTAVYGTAPSASQTYSTSAPSLPMSGASGASDTNLKFTVSCGLLEITLTQEGESIKSISVSDNASTPNTYILSCGDGVSIASGAKFYIAVPAGTYTKFQFTNGTDVVRDRNGLSIVVEANHIKPMSSNFAPKYTSGTTDADYGIKVGSKWWAPVNCGYDATNYKYGKLYQFGRAVGGGYNKSGDANNDAGGEYQIAETSATVSSTAKTNPTDNVFYLGTFGSSNDWYITTGTRLSLWPMKSGDAGYVEGKIANPCPAGWRVPTYDELNALFGGNSSPAIIEVGGQNGCYFNGTSSASSGVFLPAAGYRVCGDGSAYNRGNNGNYWSSSVNGDNARYLYFSSYGAGMDHYYRANGYSVRCIKE